MIDKIGECGCNECVCENSDNMVSEGGPDSPDTPTIDVGISVDKIGEETSTEVNIGISIPFGEKKPIC